MLLKVLKLNCFIQVSCHDVYFQQLNRSITSRQVLWAVYPLPDEIRDMYIDLLNIGYPQT